jgi:hypothetical protein
MSSNGLVLFFALSVITIFIPSAQTVPVYGLILGLLFSLSMGWAGIQALKSAVISVVPLFVLLIIVWGGIVSRVPDASIFFSTGKPISVWIAVSSISIRLFLLALFTFAVVKIGAKGNNTFINGLSIPLSWKVILLAAISLADILKQGSQRAHTALVTANILTAKLSFRNISHGWLLLRTTWVAAIGITSERLDTKWAYEDLPSSALERSGEKRVFTWIDIFWIMAAITVIIATIISSYY